VSRKKNTLRPSMTAKGSIKATRLLMGSA